MCELIRVRGGWWISILPAARIGVQVASVHSIEVP